MRATKPVFYQRWNLQHRLQHGCLAISMMGLLTTGLAIKFHYVGWAQWLFKSLGGFQNSLMVHKASAILIVIVSVWHVGFLLFNWKRPTLKNWAMLPSLKDLTDVKDHMLYLLSLKKTPPQFDRYSYLEKFEYLAIFWGMVVMGLTGFALWAPTVAAEFVPRFYLQVFRIIHSNEAVVAVITLAYGHFFTAHLNPAVFPSNPVWLFGKISMEHMLEEHPIEYERLIEEGKLPAKPIAPHHGHGLAGWRRALAGFELLVYSAVFYYLLIVFIPLLLA